VRLTEIRPTGHEMNVNTVFQMQNNSSGRTTQETQLLEQLAVV
jgi:hypothetical protein